MSESTKRLETVETLSALVGLPQRTVVREVRRGRLPYVNVAGNWRFRERDVEVWLQRAGPLPRMRLVHGGLVSGPSDSSSSSRVEGSAG